MSTNTQFNWLTSDKFNIFAQKWAIDQNPKAVVIIVHGLGEHSSRYNHMAKFFNEKNIVVYSFDHCGHGRSSGVRGDIPSYDHACNEINYLIEVAQKEFPLTPVFLYGHSLGGAIVLYYAVSKDSNIKGIICTSPALKTGAPLPPLKIIFAKILNAIVPKVTMNNGLDVNNLSHDQNVINAYKEDPLVHPNISVRLGMELIENGAFLVENANQIKYPVLLLQGEKDHLVNPKSTCEFAQNAVGKNIQFIQYPELFHEMHNELDNQDFLNTISNWLDSQIS